MNRQNHLKAVLSGLLLFCLLIPGHPSRAASGEPGKQSGDLILLPFVYYTPETSTAVVLTGIYTKRGDEQDSRPSSLMAFLTYTAENQRAMQVVPELYTGSSLKITGGIGALDFPDKFYGTGTDVSDDDEEEYVQVSSNFSAAVQLEVLPRFHAGIKYDYENLKIEDVKAGGLIDSGLFTGSDGGEVSGGGFVLTYDSRDDLFLPKTGFYAETTAMFYDEGLGSDFDYETLALDLRQFISPGTITLGFQQYMQLSSGDPPFHRLGQMGGSDLMRGFFRGKFRDRNLAALQTETRIPLSIKFGLVFFGSAGNVASSPGDLVEDSFLTAFGTGLRYRVGKEEPINLRLDLAVAEGGESGVYFTIREAF